MLVGCVNEFMQVGGAVEAGDEFGAALAAGTLTETVKL
jgi:hypothetical protein